jgi:hypothetical protein
MRMAGLLKVVAPVFDYILNVQTRVGIFRITFTIIAVLEDRG